MDLSCEGYLHPTTLQLYNSNSIITLPVYLQIRVSAPAAAEEQTDEFLMYTYKVRRCPKSRSHDWTNCPYAHRGEKARRRDPRKFPYHGIACTEFRATGECRRGQNCEYAHGVFEYWLHPHRYRTRICEAGLACPRRVCFFAHTADQLRLDLVRDCFDQLHTHATSMPDALTQGHEWRLINQAVTDPCSSSLASSSAADPSMEGMKQAKVNGDTDWDDEEKNQLDFPHIDWIMDMVK